MKERLEIIDFKYKIILWAFLFFLAITFLSPISSNDWEHYITSSKGLANVIEAIKNAYSNTDGRVVSRFLIYMFTSNKAMFNIIFAALMAGLVSSFTTLIGKVNNKYYYIIPVIALLTVNVFTFAQNYTWITGTVTYTVPAIITIMYITHLYKKETFSFEKVELCSLIIINIAMPFFVENIAFAFVASNIIILIYRLIKYKKLSKSFLCFTILSIVSLVVMLASSGMELTYKSDVTFNALPLFEKIKTNIPNFISYVFTNNPFLLIFMLIPINYVLYGKTRNYEYNRLMLVMLNIIPIFSIICNFNAIAPVNINLIINKYDGLFLVENSYFIFYWIALLALFIYSIVEIIPKGKKRNYCLLLITTAILSVIPLFLRLEWSYGITILFIFTVLAISCVEIATINMKILPRLTSVIAIILVIYYIAIMSLTMYIHKTRESYIEEQLTAESEIIYVKANPFYLTWDYNPVCNNDNLEHFKAYYNIPTNTTIEVKYFGIIEQIEKNVKKDLFDNENASCR